jgi:hypothetical protein
MRRFWLGLLVIVFLAVLAAAYVRNHPLVFLEAHAHCIQMAGIGLENYADRHDGKYPFHPKGYGNALLLMDAEFYDTLTGPGYDAAPFYEAKKAGKDLPEEECGRVYVQGLTTKSNWEIALLFDKLPTPGGDHCHLPIRLWAPLCREVCCLHAGRMIVRESDWPEFAKKQVELLVEEGFERAEAERLYASKPK